MTAYGIRRAGKAVSLLTAVMLPAALLTPAASAANSLSMLGADVSTAQPVPASL